MTLASEGMLDLGAMRLQPLATISNMISATSGNQVDAMIATGTHQGVGGAPGPGAGVDARRRSGSSPSGSPSTIRQVQ